MDWGDEEIFENTETEIEKICIKWTEGRGIKEADEMQGPSRGR